MKATSSKATSSKSKKQTSTKKQTTKVEAVEVKETTTSSAAAPVLTTAKTQKEYHEQLQHEVNKNLWMMIDEVCEEAKKLKDASEANDYTNTAKCYDSIINSIPRTKKQIERTEKVKANEVIKNEKEKDKPKKEKTPPYSYRFVETISIEGKLKDKYELQKTATSPIVIKYKTHKPEGLNDEQKDIIKSTLSNLKEQVEGMQTDFTYRQYTTFINSILYPKKEKEEKEEETKEDEEEKLTSSEELELKF